MRLSKVAYDPRVVPLLLQLAVDPSEKLSQKAQDVLLNLPTDDARDQLCEEVIQEPKSLAFQLCQKLKLLPRDDERRCLYLFITLQFDQYFEEDYQFQHLRAVFERADSLLKRRLLSILRSGDQRLLGFFMSKKPLRECDEREVEFALKSFLKHQDREKLFQAFLELPLKYGLRILHDLSRTDWQPDTPEHLSLYNLAQKEASQWLPPRQESLPSVGKIFEYWLQRGEESNYSDWTVEEILSQLDTVSPPEGVSLVQALSKKVTLGSDASRYVRLHPHWLVRLAAIKTGLGLGVERDSMEDSNYWLNHLAPKHPLLEISPNEANPALLEELERFEHENSDSELQPARKVLQILMAHRMTTGSFESMQIEIDDYVGEFEFVDDNDDEEPLGS